MNGGATLLIAAAVAVNSAFCVLGMVAANHYNIEVALARGRGLAIVLAATVVEAAALLLYPQTASSAAIVIAFGAAIAGAACDAACGYVFDAITLPALASMLLVAAVTHDVARVLTGAAAAGGALALLYAITRGRGLGLGDVKLACCIGAASGTRMALEALGIAFVLGGAYAGFVLLTRRGNRKDEMRFGPYLLAGFAAVALRGALG
jgi:prepilin signal peptidase PulO-like enzyme (type II secretory pathway)